MGLTNDYLQWIDQQITAVFGTTKSRLCMLELGDQVIDAKSGLTGKHYYQAQGMHHTSVDINGKHGSVIRDLRTPQAFADWHGQFDIITNSGTTEHVEPKSSQYDCFSIIQDCLRLGGIQMHLVPDVYHHDNYKSWAKHCRYYYSQEFFESMALHSDLDVIDIRYINGLICACLRKNNKSKFMANKTLFLESISTRNVDLIIPLVVQKNTMVTPGRVLELAAALDQVLTAGVPGDIVECGTWRGGLAALMLDRILHQAPDRRLWIYDTFQGMTEPDIIDVSVDNHSALDEFRQKYDATTGCADWCRAGLDVVLSTLQQVCPEPAHYVNLIQGKVEDTLMLDTNLPNDICVLRLDTDWYTSTRKEFEILYPRVRAGGVVIVDDYSYWAGSHKATDEYLAGIDADTYATKMGDSGSLIIHKLR